MPVIRGSAMKVHIPCLLAILVSAGVLAPRALAQCEVQKLTASDPGCKNYYGRAVAIDGTTALVGAWGHAEPVPNAGAAYVYELGPSGWVETAELLAGDPDLGDVFGEAVAISGDTALVTAPGDDEAASLAGAAYIFERTAGVWVQTQKLFASDAGSGAYWGNAASMSGDRAIIGNRLAHAAYVFERSGGFWVEVAKLTASDRGSDWFGVSVSISEDGETVIVGAYYDDDACVNDPNCNSGSAYIFERTPGGWVETAKLTASDGAKEDWFGYSVSIGGDVAVVSDAGTPLVSDPGQRLVAAAIRAGFEVQAVPGASALLSALTISGLSADRFLFVGFLPRKASARDQLLERLQSAPETLVFFESPQRLAGTLVRLAQWLGSRRACVARELTKLHEEAARGLLQELAERFADGTRGEVTLVVEGAPPKPPVSDIRQLDAAICKRLAEGESCKDIAAELAPESGLSKRAIYARAIALK